jgi:hypothetical protein
MSATLPQVREKQIPSFSQEIDPKPIVKKPRRRKKDSQISHSLHTILNEFELCLNLSAGLSKRELEILLDRCTNIIGSQIIA